MLPADRRSEPGDRAPDQGGDPEGFGGRSAFPLGAAAVAARRFSASCRALSQADRALATECRLSYVSGDRAGKLKRSVISDPGVSESRRIGAAASRETQRPWHRTDAHEPAATSRGAFPRSAAPEPAI